MEDEELTVEEVLDLLEQRRNDRRRRGGIPGEVSCSRCWQYMTSHLTCPSCMDTKREPTPFSEVEEW